MSKVFGAWKTLVRQARFVTLALLAWGLLLVPASAWSAPDWLDADERAWLTAHPVIRIGVDPSYAPYSFVDDKGRFQGASADFLELIQADLGIRFERVPLADWPSLIDAIKAGRIDMLNTVALLPERREFLAFTNIYLQTPLAVVTREQQPRLASLDDLAQLRMVLVRGYSSSTLVLSRYPEIEHFFVKTPLDALTAVSEGHADAYVGVIGVNLHLARTYGLSNLKVSNGFDLRENGQRLAVRRDWAPLARILDKALARIPETQRAAIMSRWLPMQALPATSTVPVWSPAERAWLADHPVIRVGVERDREPFAFVDKSGQPAGLAVDTVGLALRRAGLEARWVGGDVNQLDAMLRDGELDALVVSREWVRHGADLRLTQAYYDSQFVMICPRQVDCSDGLDAFAGRSVVVRNQSAAHELALRYPAMQLVRADDDKALLQALRDGRAQVGLAEMRTIYRALDSAEGAGLHVGRFVNDAPMRLQLGVRFDWPQLVAVVNKSLGTLTPEDHARLRAPWVGPFPAPPVGLDRDEVLRWAALAAGVTTLLVAVMLWWNRRLKREVERRRDVEQALAKAAAAAAIHSQHKSQFVAQTSHELRTPLNAVLGGCQLLQDTPLDDGQQRLLRMVNGAAKALQALVEDLLDMARIESGRLELQPAPLCLPELLEEALTFVGAMADKKGLLLHLRTGPGLPEWVQGDARRLRQVLVNLLTNGVKYTASGSVTLRAEVIGEQRLLLAVEDTGQGIPPALLRRVFDPFFQVTRGDGNGAGGIGLGLGIARNLVEAMGGELRLSSIEGQGSRFFFEVELPPTDPPAEAAEADGQAGGGTTKPIVLLVEDDEVNRLIASEMLGRCGWQLVEADTGRAALARVGQQPAIGLVLMDLGLPDIDGLEVTRLIRAMDGPQAEVPIIGLTARAMQQDHDDCISAGMNDVVLKPFELPRLLKAMHGALSAHAERAHRA